ncbi:MAG: ribosome silencing factor [Johnsonella sp.]|nr:ribosome silencing factor [Johnsonella sp.]
MEKSRKLVEKIYKALEEKKGENIKVLDISKVSTLADYFILADGNNINQVQAMADEIEVSLEKEGMRPKQIEGYRSGSWILMDYHDVVVHVFTKEDRQFYDLERIWMDASLVEMKQ